MKYLYVLTSDKKDFYFEQALLSITSIRMKMPNAFVSLLMDDMTAGSLTDNRDKIHELVDEIKIINLPEKMVKMERSRWLKTSMRHHISGDFLYIDCDTIIADDLSGINDIDLDIGAVLDIHSLLNENHTKKSVQIRGSKVGFNASFVSDKYYNSGVIFCKDTPICHNFFQEWHRLWLVYVSKGIRTDQNAFNQANVMFNNLITELDGVWNCQIEYGGIAYLADSKIIHYFSFNKSEPAYTLANQGIFQNIKTNGCITQDINELLKYPKRNINRNSRLIGDKNGLMIVNSKLFYVCRKCVSKTFLNSIDSVIAILLNIFIFNKNLFTKKK
ncbi:hypothetical protein AGMMS49928_27640 [Spirochaetia bacterium]|nr:hypothetical protein AGMMS49928_27640 [Spirochaetia bacterium]